eukprot:6225242-Amphidinium_carterae.1
MWCGVQKNELSARVSDCGQVTIMEGPLAEWNVANPGFEVKVGDLLVQVNKPKVLRAEPAKPCLRTPTTPPTAAKTALKYLWGKERER